MPTGEVNRLGDEIDECDTRLDVKPDHDGRYVGIDADNGCSGIGRAM